jgi:hypothetical protein
MMIATNKLMFTAVLVAIFVRNALSPRFWLRRAASWASEPPVRCPCVVFRWAARIAALADLADVRACDAPLVELFGSEYRADASRCRRVHVRDVRILRVLIVGDDAVLSGARRVVHSLQ